MRGRTEKNSDLAAAGREDLATLIARYGCGPLEFSGTGHALYERHLTFDNVVAVSDAGPREQFEAFARSVRVAASGKFSSDRTIAEYAAKIWDARSCPVSAR